MTDPRQLPKLVLIAIDEVQRWLEANAGKIVDDTIRRALVERLDAPELKPGDVGLQLWLDVVAGRNDAPALVDRLEKLAPFEECEGMEVAWIVQGLALEYARGGSVRAKRLHEQVLGLLLGRNRAASGLFYHYGSSGPRRLLPELRDRDLLGFGALHGRRLGLDGRAEEAARAAADVLLARQLGDGGWPWLYDARDGGASSRTRCTPSTSTPWRRWASLRSRRPAAKSATLTPPCGDSGGSRAGTSSGSTWSTRATG